MMDERELDRAIDTAAGRMMAREPGRALSYTVMTRVRARNAPASRRFVWIMATASLVLCGAMAIALMYQAPAMIIAPPPAAQFPIVEPPIAQLPMVADAPVTVIREMPPSRRGVSTRMATKVVLPMRLPPDDISAIEPIETEPIALSALDVPQLEREATSIETLTIEPLTVEPLTASND
jgi:hypothetical protein